MPIALIGQIGLGYVNRLVQRIVRECRKRGAHLFFTHQILFTDTVSLDDQHPRPIRHGNARLICQILHALPNHIARHLAILKNSIDHLIPLRLRHNIRSVVNERLKHLFLICPRVNKTLLARANDAVVERTARDNRRRGLAIIHPPINNHLHVTSPYTVGRFPRRVGRLHHSHPARRQHHINSTH